MVIVEELFVCEMVVSFKVTHFSKHRMSAFFLSKYIQPFPKDGFC